MLHDRFILTILVVFELIYVGAASVALNLIAFDKIPTLDFSVIKKNILPFSSRSICLSCNVTRQIWKINSSKREEH